MGTTMKPPWALKRGPGPGKEQMARFDGAPLDSRALWPQTGIALAAGEMLPACATSECFSSGQESAAPVTAESLDILAIGNAIVDVLARTDEQFLLAHGCHKGAMTLVDEVRAQAIYHAMGPGIEVSGGSAANTAVGVAAFGGAAGFIGLVKADELGKVFAHDIRAAGVAYRTFAAEDGPGTGRCLVLVTPDGERTMNTYLGAAQNLGPSEIDPVVVQSARVTYLEGYLWDPPEAKAAFLKAADIAHAAGRQVALSLSDAFCVERYRDEFLRLLRTGVVDLVFCNEAEVKSLYGTADVDTALAALRVDARQAVVTRGAQGALHLTREAQVSVPAHRGTQVVDTTGAGDLFAAGVLFGLTHGVDPGAALRLGALAAAEVISHFGARPQRDLKDLAQEAGLMPVPAMGQRHRDLV